MTWRRDCVFHALGNPAVDPMSMSPSEPRAASAFADMDIQLASSDGRFSLISVKAGTVQPLKSYDSRGNLANPAIPPGKLRCRGRLRWTPAIPRFRTRACGTPGKVCWRGLRDYARY